VVAARAYRISSPSSSNTALYRLGKLLNQGGSKNQMVVDDSNVTRRLSWERWVQQEDPNLEETSLIVLISRRRFFFGVEIAELSGMPHHVFASEKQIMTIIG
jgi:hypothetical protein